MTSELAYLATLQPPDLAAARRLCTKAIDAGEHIETIVDTMLLPAQVEVGRRWHSNEWTVPQEHAASAVTDALLQEFALRTQGPGTQPGRVVTGCAEGEWHTIPVQMLNIGLITAGYDVVTLGPSLPPEELGAFLADLDPIALLLSCTLPTNLAGARRCVEAAHSAGVPVIAGGRAFGADNTRARAIGADAWAAHPHGASSYLHSWTKQSPTFPRGLPLQREQIDLESPPPSLVDDCVQQLLQDAPSLRFLSETEETRTREDIARTLQFCSAALLVADHTVFDEFTEWLIQFLATRHVPVAVIRSSYHAIASVLSSRYPATVELLESGLKRLGNAAATGEPAFRSLWPEPSAPSDREAGGLVRTRGKPADAPYSVLVLEDCQDDFELLVSHLQGTGVAVSATLVDNELDFRRELAGEPDVIVSDYNLPAFDGRKALAIRNQLFAHVPFILISGYLSDPDAVQLLEQGATDFLLKDRLARLGPAVVGAVTSRRSDLHHIGELTAVLDGSVGALSEALALANPPAFARALRIRDLARAIAKGMAFVDPDTVGTIALLSQLGTLTLPLELATKLHEGRNVTDADRQMVKRLPAVTVALLGTIPSLDHARHVILCQDLSFDPGGPVPVEARILRLAIAYDRMEARGTPFAKAIQLLRTRESLYGADCIEAMVMSRPPIEEDNPTQKVGVSEALIGWVLASDVTSRSGVLLIGHGHRVSVGLRARLEALAEEGTINGEIWICNPTSANDA